MGSISGIAEVADWVIGGRPFTRNQMAVNKIVVFEAFVLENRAFLSFANRATLDK